MIEELKLDNFEIECKRNYKEYKNDKFPDDLKIDQMSSYGVLVNLKKSDIESSVQDLLRKILYFPPYKKQRLNDLNIQIDKLESDLANLQKQSNEKDEIIIKQNKEIGSLKKDDSVCFHCRKEVYLETESTEEDSYFIYEYEEMKS